MQLPLRLGVYAPGTVYDAAGRHILTVHDPTVDPRVIVRAVNAYRALRDACEAALRAIETNPDDRFLTPEEAVEKLRAALELARKLG